METNQIVLQFNVLLFIVIVINICNHIVYYCVNMNRFLKLDILC